MAAIDSLDNAATGKSQFASDLFRFLSAASVAIGLALECVSVAWPDHKFDIQSFGIGMGALLGAAGAAVFAHSWAVADRIAPEPTPPPEKTP